MMETILEVSNLTVTLSNGMNIVKDVSFELHSGDVVALVGENSAGKSTILKAIVGEEDGDKTVTGSVKFEGEELLSSSGDRKKRRQNFLAKIAYVPQTDNYHESGHTANVFDVMMQSASSYKDQNSLGKKTIGKNDITALFDRYQLRIFDEKTKKPLFYEKSCPAKLSGGLQRMLSIISAIAVREHAKLFIIDEPLNNLDFKNARKVSNLITRIHKENPDAAILMVTHCKIFPVINRLITIKDGVVVPSEEKYQCHSCFGKANAEGYYE